MIEYLSRFLVLALLLAWTGCNKQPQPTAGQPPASESARARQQRFDDIIGKLNSLPNYVNLELQPPRVLLDARSSTDGEEILAVCGPSPDFPNGPNNILTVVTKNAGFRRGDIAQDRRIQPGDLVRYFAKLDEDSQEFEIVAYGYFEMQVAQVLDDNRILVDPGLTHPVTDPFKLQIWRHVDERTQTIRERLKVYQEFGLYPLHWQPSPDEVILEQILQGLNQWFARARPRADWEPPSLIETLPDELWQAKDLRPFIGPEALGHLIFDDHEPRLLQQAIWLRDIGFWARGNAIDALDRAAVLFDWTIRNIQLVEASDRLPPRDPWEVLLHGQGTAIERAWVFALLCRHQRLDIVILHHTHPIGSDPGSEGTEPAVVDRVLPALFRDGTFHLFDPELGLPIPGPGGAGIATLKQAQTDPAIFRQLDLDGDHRYPGSADAWQSVTAGIVASPLALSHRARILESQLAGKDAFVLTAPDAKLAEQMRATGLLEHVELWGYPFRILLAKRRLPTNLKERDRPEEQLKRIQRTIAAIDFCVFALIPELWKARVLHFQGKRETITDREHPGLIEEINSHREALKFYRLARPTARELERILSPEELKYRTIAKQHASYWTGLMCWDDGKYEVAIDWLKKRTLDDWPDGLWTDGARYNLGRAYEEAGRHEDAISVYEMDTSPQRHGNRLRAKRLHVLLSEDTE